MNEERRHLLDEVEATYRELKGGMREVRESDRFVEDLDVDSLLAYEILVGLEERHGVELIPLAQTRQLATVGDLLDLLEQVVPRAERSQ